MVKENAEICSAFQPDKAVLLNLPRINIVLEKTFLIALYNSVALLMLKHHTENARLRNKGVDSVVNFIKSAVPDFIKRKPGSVKIVNIINVIS